MKIESYPKDKIHANADGSSVNAFASRRCGSDIDKPYQEELILFSKQCGEHCDNYDADIQTTLNTYSKSFEINTVQQADRVIFNDSQAANFSIYNGKSEVPGCHKKPSTCLNTPLNKWEVRNYSSTNGSLMKSATP